MSDEDHHRVVGTLWFVYGRRQCDVDQTIIRAAKCTQTFSRSKMVNLETFHHVVIFRTFIIWYAVKRKNHKIPFKLKSSFYNYSKHNLVKKLPTATCKKFDEIIRRWWCGLSPMSCRPTFSIQSAFSSQKCLNFKNMNSECWLKPATEFLSLEEIINPYLLTYYMCLWSCSRAACKHKVQATNCWLAIRRRLLLIIIIGHLWGLR